MASPHHRHQVSLETTIDFGVPQPLDVQIRERATQIFYQIIDHFECSQKTDQYKRITLLRATYEYAPSKDSFICHFFLHTGEVLNLIKRSNEPQLPQVLSYLSGFESMTNAEKDNIGITVAAFAELIFERLLLPLKAAGGKTPQPSPTQLSSNQELPDPVGTPYRLSTLREKCLKRDRYRCVISRKFDQPEAIKRGRMNGNNAADDDGRLLVYEQHEPGFEFLEVAHILPYSLMSTGSKKGELPEPKLTALQILNMFDPEVIRLIDGVEIDRPYNAITLTYHFHRLFGSFKIYFEPSRNTKSPHTYNIDTTETTFVRHPIFPVTRSLYLSPDRNIDPPSTRLLALHRAIVGILHLSGAGEYAERILQDMETAGCKEDGSSELGQLISLKLGWLDGVSAY